MHASFLSSGWAHVLQVVLPHSRPLHGFLLERIDPRAVPPFSATLTLNFSIGANLSSVSLMLFWRDPPLENSTNSTVVVLSLSDILMVLLQPPGLSPLSSPPVSATLSARSCAHDAPPSSSSPDVCLNQFVLASSFLVLLEDALWPALLCRGVLFSIALATLLLYPFIPLINTLLLVLMEWPLFTIFLLNLSISSILSPWPTVLLKLSSLLITSLLKDRIKQLWFNAVSAWRHLLEEVGFSKKEYSMMLSEFTLILKSRVGSHPSAKSSHVSAVNARHLVSPCMLANTTLLVLSMGESSASSSSHSFLNHNPPSSHLHPALTGYR